ncbi:TIGR02444 family protein [Marinospirillum sp. MEB164]|uniref:TIGR02444 family protein n=1 Tax=Marinospirillum alkalitolerans TaxID=3123374 RepID=A0ABW8PX61_9GAMM
MLLHDNPFWRFSLGLYQVQRFEEACLTLQDESGANINLLLFALWSSRQKLRLAPDWQQAFRQFHNWNQDFTQSLRLQRRQLKTLAARGDRHEHGPLHRMREHLLKAEEYSEQQEQAILYYYYQQRQGLVVCEEPQAALIANLIECFDDAQTLNVAALLTLLTLYLDESEAEEVAAQVIARVQARADVIARPLVAASLEDKKGQMDQ